MTFDFHLHSCLSPCGDGDMTPANIAGMCALAGIQAVALTDHNTCGNCAAFCAAAEALGLLALPGMELTTAEEVHVVCLLPGLDEAAAFSAAVYRRLPDLPNDAGIFGEQIRMDAADGVLGEEPRLLAGAADIGVYDAAALAERYGGVAYPAHIDRPSFSLLSNLGLWDPFMGFRRAELSRSCPPDILEKHPDLAGVPTLTGSDAHYLDQIMDAHQTMKVPRRTARAVLDWLKGGAHSGTVN